MNQINIYDTASIDRLRAELRVEPRCVRRLRTVFLKKSQGVAAALAELPADVRDQFARRFEFHTLSVESRFDSELDGATKLVLRTRRAT